ncbi:DUF6265 family protein [Sphingomonas sp.]|uniref:DUF6265 family protein n=1 Tax=Sphingomonas sp. TaxID=28214 RepID=UPI00286E95FD|nr:DUF6265 family protein [Sphingomonas sp.]
MRQWTKLALMSLATACPASAVAANTAPAPAAKIADAAWLAGRWVGQGLGGEIEENWSPAADGQMVGHFQLTSGGKVKFYELEVIDEQPAGLRMRVKHFNRDFTGWEEKGGWHSFEPVSATPGVLKFRGLTLTREGADAMTIGIMLKEDGKVREETLRLRRAPL